MSEERPRWRRKRVLVVLGGVVAAAALFWIIAPYNIAASVPHLPGVRWILNGYLHNAVRTWSLGVERPAGLDLDDPALIARGAGHFETGCAPCHGAPGRARNPVVLGMRPEPPDLTEAVPDYADRELAWIVRNGFKYSGMPAWPTQLRPEEPWALAAFLRRYPDLDSDRYVELAFGKVEPGRVLPHRLAVDLGGRNADVSAVQATCARCHGQDGDGRDGVAPRLAGQSRAFLVETLEAYATGERPSGFMQPVAASLSPAQIEALAASYALMGGGGREAALAGAAPGRAGADMIAAGRAIATAGVPERDLPACVSCHGPGPAEDRRPVFPHLAGQHREFLVAWLRLWRERAFGGTGFANVMHEAARTLTDDQIAAVATWYAAGAPPAETVSADGR